MIAGSMTGPDHRAALTDEVERFQAKIRELAKSMSSGTEIDAAFLTRYGPPGLVAAARRVFGRFDAAMNVAALHFSNLYPDGPPAKPGQAIAAAAQSPAFRPRRGR